MEVFKKIGSKDRLFELMHGVNKLKLNEEMGEQSEFIGKAFNGLVGGEVVPQGYYVWDSYDGGETWDYANFHSYQTDVGMYNEYVLYAVENGPGFAVDDVLLDELHVWIGWPGNQHSTHRTTLFDSEGNMHLPEQFWICSVDTVAASASYWPLLRVPVPS